MQLNLSKTNRNKGLVSIAAVVGLSLLLVALLMAGFRRALVSQEIERTVQLQIDYAHKEDAFVRSVVGFLPAAAAGCMQDNSANDSSLRWRSVFNRAGEFANVESSTQEALPSAAGVTDFINANVGDQNVTNWRTMVTALARDNRDVSGAAAQGGTLAGINAMGDRLPPILSTNGSFPSNVANNYPVLSPLLEYGSEWSSRALYSVSNYPQFNAIPYPNISFGYTTPGQPFIAKHNWWAFEAKFASPQQNLTGINSTTRRYCLSLYEVPSQLAISAAGFAQLGRNADGTDWSNINITGSVYADQIDVQSGDYERIAARRQIGITGGGVSGANSYHNMPGGREQFAVDNNQSYDSTAAFLPIASAGDSGRVAFVPINVGSQFYDFIEFSDPLNAESNVRGDYRWSEYSRGAMQCDIWVRVIEVDGSDDGNGGLDQTPTAIEVSYKESNGSRNSQVFNSDAWPDPNFPFNVGSISSGETSCLFLYVERLPAFITGTLGANLADNRSIAINPDYNASLSIATPTSPPTDGHFTVVLREAEDLSGFSSGFSLVTSQRLYIDTNFNQVSTAAPSGYPTAFLPFYPPASIYAPEVRYGADQGSSSVRIDGQIGSLGLNNGSGPSNPVELRQADGSETSQLLEANLAPLRHPADLPPVSMMNWLIVAEPIND